ncbi:MAG TPA: hypothetical protein V6D26_28990 [Stenomitos sp.]
MEKEPRTYTSAQLTKKLQQERLVDLSSDRLRRLLKKNYRWKRTRQSHRHNQDSVKKVLKQADLDTLKLATLSDCCFILKMIQEDKKIFDQIEGFVSLSLEQYQLES